ncbi:MAG: hypothetical protein JSU78_05275 [Deltaproteobacteria bacterium]|nr:MAG: hypothetical protein JSU78_05275 [Deltaproteobacteria bacterium]
MNKKMLLYYIVIFIFGIGLVLFNVSESFAFEFYEEDLDFKIRGSVIISGIIGYRMDNLDWNIAGDQYGNNPNILSELEFNDLEIYQAGLELKLTLNRIYFRASIYFGEITHGEGTDSDYDQDNRNGLYSRSQFEINNDDVQDMGVGLGYQFDLLNKKLRLVPLIGISYHEQNLCITNGVQTVGSADLEGLNSAYQTEWTSWWLGMDISFEVMTNLFLSSSLEYHLVDYQARANWNLREDFAHPVSFSHNADGKGTAMKIGISHFFAEHWAIGLLYGRQKWSASGGYDYLFLATGETITSKLNEVDWDSRSINLLLSYNS